MSIKVKNTDDSCLLISDLQCQGYTWLTQIAYGTPSTDKIFPLRDPEPFGSTVHVREESHGEIKPSTTDRTRKF